MTAPELTATEFSRYLENPTDEDSAYADGVYDHMAAFCLQKICEMHPQLRKGSTRSGYRVVSRLVKFAAALYPEHAKEQGLEPKVDSLRDILLNSVSTPLRFAYMPLGVNNQVEHAFGLATTGIPSDIGGLYRFEANTARGTLFIADDDQFARVVGEGRALGPAFDATSKCPMTEVTKKVVWPGVVNLAAEAPELFASDLGLIDN